VSDLNIPAGFELVTDREAIIEASFYWDDALNPQGWTSSIHEIGFPVSMCDVSGKYIYIRPIPVKSIPPRPEPPTFEGFEIVGWCEMGKAYLDDDYILNSRQKDLLHAVSRMEEDMEGTFYAIGYRAANGPIYRKKEEEK